MIIRYFGGKDALFAHVAAPDLALPDLSDTDPAKIGELLVHHFLEQSQGQEGGGGAARDCAGARRSRRDPIAAPSPGLLRLPPVVAIPVDLIVCTVGETVQRYATGITAVAGGGRQHGAISASGDRTAKRKFKRFPGESLPVSPTGPAAYRAPSTGRDARPDKQLVERLRCGFVGRPPGAGPSGGRQDGDRRWNEDAVRHRRPSVRTRQGREDMRA